MTNKEAIEILKSWDGWMFLEREEGRVGYSYKKEVSQEAVDTAITALQNERQTGEWKVNNYGEHVCPICGHYALYDEDHDNDYHEVQSNFCPNCGEDLRGDKE